MYFKSSYNSCLGKIELLCDDTSIKGIWFEQQKHYGGKHDLEAAEERENSIIRQTKIWLDEYFSGKHVTLNKDLLTPEGTDFQKIVFEILTEIPYGEVITYKEIADVVEKRRGTKTSPRAVGNAVGRNPISILIPCHRVIGSDGALTGYAGGVERKRELLRIEGVEL